MDVFANSLRMRYERSRLLDLRAQLEECVDYLEHPEILLMEFLETYYLVERKLDPEQEDERREASAAELVLEPFYPSLELQIRGPGDTIDRISCLGGAFEPLSGASHPALSRSGLDYVGLRHGTSRIALGVTETCPADTPYHLILRAFCCLAEVAPPFQLARFQRHVLGKHLRPDVSFDLQLGLSRREASDQDTSLLLLTRDLAEVFKERMSAHEQFAGTLARIECLEFGENPASPKEPLHVRWRV